MKINIVHTYEHDGKYYVCLDTTITSDVLSEKTVNEIKEAMLKIDESREFIKNSTAKNVEFDYTVYYPYIEVKDEGLTFVLDEKVGHHTPENK